MFIDIHVHTRTKLIPGVQPYATPEQLIARYDHIGVEKAVILPGGISPECAAVPQSVLELPDICARFPGRFIPFCNVDPRALTNSETAPLDKLLTFYKEHGYKGVGEVTCNLPFLHPLVQNLFRHVEEVGLPLTFHIAPQIGGCYGLYDDPGLPQVERCLQNFPQLVFLGHSQPFWAEISRLETPADRYGYPKYPVREEGVLPKLFRRYPNLMGDLSANSGYNALARDPEYAVKFLTEFQDRLLFGTDICAPDTPTPLVDFLLKLREEKKIDEQVFQKVARLNALRLLNLAD
ncbi:MAG: amidohydrolase family protein [Candidatus Omnitrophica bacterium]|nr:amidohydrolase family protein [Candidatus Omnitrophota bacterium]MCM8768716.1 amidohydrolase family protein [Candidatus Omnitrophota bacterium]